MALDVNPDDLRANQYWSNPDKNRAQYLAMLNDAERDDIRISRPFDIAGEIVCDCFTIDRRKYVSASCYKYIETLARPKGVKCTCFSHCGAASCGASNDVVKWGNGN
jgi:hypothetical protein